MKSGWRKKTWVLLGLGLLLLALGMEWALDGVREEEKQLRTQWRQTLLRQFPALVGAAGQRYGLRPFCQGREEDACARAHLAQGRGQEADDFPLASLFGLSQAPGRPESGKPESGGRGAVVLIHGLDDPGKVWMNLAPVLEQAGFAVWLMYYPDDQPISASAQLLGQALRTLRRQGVERLDLVAHSMGGLVSRELLTHPQWRDWREAGLPQIDQLIMLGTPNQGSELARFRGLAEWRDQFSELLDGDFHWLGFILDGAGEAGIDLLPGSRFLQQLNARPNPAKTRLSVIAAELGKTDRERVQALARSWTPSSAQSAESLAWLSQLGRSLGDGLVSVESARLSGAEFYLLEGSHLSMIRNVLESSQRLPPAVPLVLKLLQRGAQANTSIP